MTRTYGYSANFDKETEELFKNAKFLGEGHNGIVYELPNKKSIKIFLDKKICYSEAEILYKVKESNYFPKIYKSDNLYIVREMIYGERLDDYIIKYGLSERLAINLYKMIEEFKRLKFTKLDARCRDIYVDSIDEVRLIDPKQCYSKKVTFPRHLMKGLDKIRVLEQFLIYIKKYNKPEGEIWESKYKKSLEKNLEKEKFKDEDLDR